jgi:hypothetical protein
MFVFRSLRTGTGLMAIVALMLLITLNLGGCCSDSETSPTSTTELEPPILPVAEQLQFDFSFFDPGKQLEKAGGNYDNFVNAYLRTVVLDAMARLVLVAPVSAFSAAVHTVPVAQADGSWVWTYDWQHGHDTIRIILRGMPAGDVVEWDLSLAPGAVDDGVLWFSGTTNGDGSEGHWGFHDLNTDGYPVSGEITWGTTGDGNYLEFVCREPDNDGDRLRFSDNDPDFRIEFTPGDGAEMSFIQWHASGEGSLRVPDYNGGTEACWGVDLRNVECE